ncbi:MAG: helix-turn-helix domain-containing protein [Chloroflexota bacterium]|nr:helix-turn-helix domain-containing protein [Chloroflexota bacterium]
MGTIDSGLTVAEAAERCGCSEKTIRRRIKNGQLCGVTVPTAKGFEWRVYLDTDQTPTLDKTDEEDGQEDVQDTQDDVQVDHAALVRAFEVIGEREQEKTRMIERLQHQNLELAGRCGYLQAKLEAAERQVLALSAPAETRGGGDRAPWWRRLLRMEPA